MTNSTPATPPSDRSSPTSPLPQSSIEMDRARAHSNASSATSATSLSSSDLEELDEETMGPDHVKIAGIDTALEQLDLGTDEGAGHEHEHDYENELMRTGMEIKAKTITGQEEGKEENGSDRTVDEVQEGEGYDEDDPVYQYTLSLFEYTKRQYLEARWHHEKLERAQARGQRSKRSGMEKMAASKAAQQANFT